MVSEVSENYLPRDRRGRWHSDLRVYGMMVTRPICYAMSHGASLSGQLLRQGHHPHFIDEEPKAGQVSSSHTTGLINKSDGKSGIPAARAPTLK